MSETTPHIDLPVEPEPSSFKLIFSLGMAGLLAGILLVSAHWYTSPLIESNKAEALRVAIFKVLPKCTRYDTLYLVNEMLVSREKRMNNTDIQDLESLFVGYDQDDNIIGFAIPAEEPGFQDIIRAIYGYESVSNTIIGFEVLESKETPGLGDKIFKDADFRANFKRLMVDPTITGVKKGKKEHDNEVETITGATISSKAIINMMNNSIDKWRSAMDNYQEDGK